jgi:hypothetical protein
MAQTNVTPISLYYSATSTNVPTAGNLVAGELAINTADGKLFYKDAAGVVQTIASKASNSGSFTTLTSTGQSTFATSTGVVGIGTIAPSAWGTGYGVAQLGYSSFWGATTGAVCHTSNNTYFDGTNYKYIITDSATDYYQLSGTHVWRTAVSGTAGNTVSFTERMRISSGNLLVGTTTNYATLGASVQVVNASGLGQFAGGDAGATFTYSFGRDNVTTGNFVFALNGTVIASINAGTGVYTPLSDSRVKKNIEPLQYGLDEILKLSPVTYNMVAEENSDKKHIGLIAQEVKSVIDEAVDDLIDQENQMYGLDKSGLVPVLIKAIQELNAKVTALEAQLGAK